MNVGIGTEVAQFLFWEYINFGTVWAVPDQKTSMTFNAEAGAFLCLFSLKAHKHEII
jgi:hypothetical protein